MKVTIITAVRYGAKTIATALESVRRQVLPEGMQLEHIVIDGGSTGGTVDALRSAPVTRYCTDKLFRRWMFRFATFPAHPSTFVRKAYFERPGGHSLGYKICADFELMPRTFDGREEVM